MMRVLMVLLLTQSSWSVKAMTDEPEMLIKSDVYDRETGQKLDAGMFTETLEDRDGSSSMRPVPKEGFKGSVYFAYDDAALEKFTKENLDAKMHSVFNLVNGFFLDSSSLGTTVNFTFAGYGHYNISPSLSVVETVVNDISASIGKTVNHVAFMSGTCFGYGVTWYGILCSGPTSRVSVNCIAANDDALTARIIAHEIGHTFGMGHDFGRAVTCESGVMAYTYYPKKWSNCSRMDFFHYYNNRGGKVGRFCLDPNVCVCNPKGSIGEGCTDDRNRCLCKPGHVGPKCDICWKYTENIGTEEEPECGCIMKNALYNGAVLEVIIGVPSFEACHQVCVNNPDCSHFSFDGNTYYCWTKGFKAIQRKYVGLVGGTRLCADNAKNILDCIEQDIDFPARNMRYENRDTAELCQEWCQRDGECDGWVWRPTDKRCWLQGMRHGLKYSEGFVSGPRNCHQIKPYHGPLKVCICYDNGSIGSGCPEKQSYCKSSCKPGFNGPTCRSCWPKVQNKGTAKEPDCRGLILHTSLSGGDLKDAFETKTIIHCQQACLENPDCDYFLFVIKTKICRIKGVKKWSTPSNVWVGGLRYCERNAKDCLVNGISYPYLRNINDGRYNKKSTAELCQISCLEDMKCEAWVWNPATNDCWFKNFIVSHAEDENGYFIGFRDVQLQKKDVCGCSKIGSAIDVCDNSGDCYCEKEYAGSKCEICADGYHMPKKSCKECGCYDQGSLNKTCTKSGKCHCKEGYIGPKCDKCQKDYYDSSGSCIKCDCDPRGSLGVKCNSTGHCSCKDTYSGNKCGNCIPGYYKHNDKCLKCKCHETGSSSEVCDESGQCTCKETYKGLKCNECVDGYFNVNGVCEACGCNHKGAHNKTCNDKGVCTCKETYLGKKCDKCDKGYYNVDNKCKPCGCNLIGSQDETCNNEGECKCKKIYLGIKCDQCDDGFYLIDKTTCEACGCNKKGAYNKTCDRKGRCTCEENYIGLKCDKCSEGFYLLADKSCQGCNCDKNGALKEKCDSLGECGCRKEYKGKKCDNCKNGYYKHPDKTCQLCGCNKKGAYNQTCTDKGVCPCKDNYKGDKCGQCSDGNFMKGTTCTNCGCNEKGVDSMSCDDKGECTCKDNYIGEKCNQCDNGYYRLDDGTCAECGCNEKGVKEMKCTSKGKCDCEDNYTGIKCDECKFGYHLLSDNSCEACGCSKDGTLIKKSCDNKGICPCKEMYKGDKCTECQPGYTKDGEKCKKVKKNG